MQKTLLSLIQQTRSRAGGLATYNAFWFESLVLPVLRSCGCERINLLVGLREVPKSTGEATSLHAGNA